MAADDLAPLESWAGELLAQLAPTQRRQLAREMAARLRESQQRRIATQLNPDGSSFEPRKPQLRSKKGRVRRAMFGKLRTSRFLKTDATADSAVVAFTNRVARIARAHQFGLRDRVKPGIEVKYPARELLGFAEADCTMLEQLLLDQIGGE